MNPEEQTVNEAPHRHSFAANSELRAEMKSTILDLMQLGPDDIDCRDSLLHNIATALKPGSHLTMVEFKLDTPFGPPKHMRLAKEELKNLVEAHSFRQKDEREFDYHYALTFERP